MKTFFMTISSVTVFVLALSLNSNNSEITKSNAYAFAGCQAEPGSKCEKPDGTMCEDEYWSGGSIETES